MELPARENSPCCLKVSAASGLRIGLVKSPTRARSSSIVPSGFFSVLAMNAGPDGGCSRLKLVRPQWPDSAGTEAEISTLVADPTNRTVETNPNAARLKCFAKIPINAPRL